MRLTHLSYLLALAAPFLTACGNDDDPVVDAAIAGEWNIEQYTVDIESTTTGQGFNETYSGTVVAVQPIDFVVTFLTDPNEAFSNGSMTFEGELTNSNGQSYPLATTAAMNPFESRSSWSIEGNAFVFTSVQQPEPWRATIVSRSESEMILEWEIVREQTDQGFTSTSRNEGNIVLRR